MGNIEQSAKKRRRKRNIQQALLATLAVSGILLTAMAAPNVTQLLKYLPGMDPRHARYQGKKALTALAKKGLVEFIEKDGKRYARITSKGSVLLSKETLRHALNSKKKKWWDKRWRVVIFDIPEKRRWKRDQLRNTMEEAGFIRLQDSVWVYPYDCEDFVALLKADLEIGYAVTYMIVESIENDLRLKEHFKLV